MSTRISSSGVTQSLFPLNYQTAGVLKANTPNAAQVAAVVTPKPEARRPSKGLNVTVKMATGGKSGRQGSPQFQAIPHTRIDDESNMQQYYDIGRKLGEGTFGIVKEVEHKETKETWACKAVNKEKAGNPAIKLLEREVAILKRVHHDHIITLKEVFETSKKMYLIMEYCSGGELSDVLKKRGTFTEDQAKIIIQRLAKAISYLHRNDMVHRDLKLENILLSVNPNDHHDDLYIKVTDFGLSVVKSGVGIENLLMDFCGTPMYMAPEIIDNKTYGEKCDVWAMGVICYMLLCGDPPFTSRDEEKLYDLIKNHDIKKHMSRDLRWSQKSDKVKDLIAKMLTIDPAHRFTAHEVVDHPWITGASMDTMRTGNVLDLMKDFHANQHTSNPDAENISQENDQTDSGAINGESTSKGSAGSSRASSANSKETSKDIKRHSLQGSSSKTKLSSQGLKKTRSPNPLGTQTAGTKVVANGGTKNLNSRLATTRTNGGLPRVTSDSNLRHPRR